MVRTFLEHQAHEKVRGRSVIIERGGFFAFLFLNNSYHAVHHAYPGYAWYRLPELFFTNRERFLKINKGYAYSSYREIFRRYLFKRKEPVPLPEHPKIR
jgi:fatty acid desaturase